MKPIVYEGNEPYIFVSYAHRDSDAVFAVLNELQERGYRLWYDDGIAPGSEWPEDIAQHLDAAAMVISFVTPNSMKSQNCRREINFSLTREKPFLSIVLEPTEMPLGMEMQLSAQQSIIRYNYDSWDGFIRKVLSCPDIAPCLAPPEPEPEPELAREPEPASSPSISAGDSTISATAEPKKPVLARTGKKELTEKRAQKASANKQAKGGPKVIGIAAAALVVLCALFFVFGGMGGVGGYSATTSWGAEVTSDSSLFSASKQTVTQEDLELIAASPSLTTLSLKNCDLSACDFSKVTDALGGLSKLDLSGSTGINDYSFLSALPLGELVLSGCEAFKDASAINTDQLKRLSVDGTAVEDVSALANTSITELNINNTPVSDITPLGSLSALKKLSIANTRVTSIDPVIPLEKLTSIDFSGCQITWPDRPIGSLQLVTAKLSNTELTNLGILSDCSRLKELDVSDNGSLADFSGLDKQNFATLERLNLARTGASAENLGWIGSCKSLKELTLDGISLNNLDLCANLENLESIYAAGCSITDISGLSSCANLKRIFLACNDIADISTFPELAKISRETIVDLSYNKLTTIESLPSGEYSALLLYGNDDEIACTIPEDLKAYETTVAWCPNFQKEMASKQGNISTIYLLDCPKKQQVAITNAVGTNVKFIDEEALLDMYKNNSFKYSLKYDATQLLAIRG